MKKLYFLILFATAAGVGQTSMTFQTNSFMFVKDRVVFVKDGIDLQTANNFIYLRNESQLLQNGTTAANNNKGVGKISLFQEGTVNNYCYNYWCSPIGQATAAIGNGAFDITTSNGMINRPTSNILSTAATNVASPNYDGSTSASSLVISNRWIYTYNPGTLYSQWDYIGATPLAINAGQGFTMKGTSGDDATLAGETTVNNPVGVDSQRYDFRGKANSGDITIPLLNGEQTLTGNPYPSAIDLKAFLINNPNTTGVAYFYDQDKTVASHVLTAYKAGNGIYSPVAPGGITNPNPLIGYMGLYTPATFYNYDGNGVSLGVALGTGGTYQRRFSPIGQGFYLEGTASGSTATMRDAYRVYVKEDPSLSRFERTTGTSTTNGFLTEIQSVAGWNYTQVSLADPPHIKFNAMMNNQGIRQSSLVFIPEATDGVDRAADAKSDDTAYLPADVYFVLDNKPYLINVLDFNIDKKIPMGFKNTEPTNFKFTVHQIVNFTDSENVYMHDKINNTYTDIKNGLFEVNLPAGTNNTQFEITFTNPLKIEDITTSNFSVVQNNTNQLLMVANPKRIDIKEIQLYDVVGKSVFNKKQNSVKDAYQFATSTYSDGIYIVKIISNDNKEFSQKVLVSNKK